MAHETQIRFLLQDLIKGHDIPAGTGQNQPNLKENALQILSSDRSGRTNQFEVKARLYGLVEKCRILNKDPLGNALQTRLDELSTLPAKWAPEVLSFLLALSDRPVQKTRVENLLLLKPEEAPAPLTWSEIVEEDPLEDQTAIWRDIDFAADGSDEDEDVRSAPSEFSDSEDGLGESRTEETEVDLEVLIIPVDLRNLDKLSEVRNRQQRCVEREDRSSNDSSSGPPIDEVSAVREVVFMLLGLPTTTFDEDDSGNLILGRTSDLGHALQESIANLLPSFVEQGRKLRTVRRWIKSRLDKPLEQAFQFALQMRLKAFDDTLHALQARMLNPSRMFVASLLDVQHEVTVSSHLIMQLHEILHSMVAISETQRPFYLLQSLYDQTCINQSLGDDMGYEHMAKIFFECLETYLKPVRTWMETGEICAKVGSMFIKKADEEVPLQSIWQDRFSLVYSADGALSAPRFLHVAGKKIFNTGKSINFLKQLGTDSATQPTQPSDGPLITFESVCQATDPRYLLPFPELFDAAFARWTASKHHSSSTLLRNQLQSRCGLVRSLEALEYIYFHRNGALTNNVVYPLFEKIERGKQRWNDNFSTTELLHEAFSPIDCIDIERLSVQPTSNSHKSHGKRRAMSVLEDLNIVYALPWPIANIIRPKSLTTYHHIFTLITQLQRAKFLLQRHKLPPSKASSSVSSSSALYTLHLNLLWFANTLLSHLTTLVITVSTTTMRHAISRAEDVDAMIAVHEAYIAVLEDQCFVLGKHASLRQAVVSILDLAVLFADLQVVVASEVSQSSSSPSKAAAGLRARGRRASVSSDEDEDAETPDRPTIAVLGEENSATTKPVERLGQVHGTYVQLLSIVISAVEGVAKADGGPVWQILAGNLALGAMG